MAAEMAIEQLLSEKDPAMVSFHQGYVSALRLAIEKVRQETKRTLAAQSELDDGDDE